MAARRLILVLLVLLVLSSVVAALIPVERSRQGDSTSSTTTTSTTTAARSETGELVRRQISADDPTPERIKVPRGTQLELTVTAAKLADQVEIPALGEFENLDPDFPARFDLLLLEPGEFPVRLVEAKRVIARIEVEGKARS